MTMTPARRICAAAPTERADMSHNVTISTIARQRCAIPRMRRAPHRPLSLTERHVQEARARAACVY